MPMEFIGLEAIPEDDMKYRGRPTSVKTNERLNKRFRSRGNKRCNVCGTLCEMGIWKAIQVKIFQHYSLEYLCPECYKERQNKNGKCCE